MGPLIKSSNFNFLQSSVSLRLTKLIEDKNPDYIYLILQKHLGETLDSLKNKYKVELNVIRQRIFISGSAEDIYELVNYCMGYGLSFESITMKEVRVDFNQFLNKLK